MDSRVPKAGLPLWPLQVVPSTTNPGTEQAERKVEDHRPKLSSRGTPSERPAETPAGWDAVPGEGDDTGPPPGPGHLLEVDVGADQHVAEQEDPALLGLDQLPAVTIHSLRQRLTQEQLALPGGQQLVGERGSRSASWSRGRRGHHPARHGAPATQREPETGTGWRQSLLHLWTGSQGTGTELCAQGGPGSLAAQLA